MSNGKTPKIPEEYTPISMWGYFGYQILFSIPVIGFIFTIVFAITAPNVNLKNFARAQILVWVLGYILFFILFLSGSLAALEMMM